MSTRVTLVGIVGGILAAISGIAALLVAGPDTVIVGGWMTVVAGVIAIVGSVLAGGRPGLAAVLMAAAFVIAALVAPGVIPALADGVIVFFAYLAGVALLLVGAILAFRERKAAPTRTSAGLGR